MVGLMIRLFHRRASLIMPQIKITKAPPNAHTFYHTHPSKDEPSLSSPDDFLLYLEFATTHRISEISIR